MSDINKSMPLTPRKNRGEKKQRDGLVLKALSIASGVMVMIGLNSLWDATGPLVNLKILLISVSSGLVSYYINKIAIERGTPLAAIGYPAALVASIGGIVVIGLGLFIASLTGLIYDDVRERIHLEHASNLAAFTSSTYDRTLAAAHVLPLLEGVSDQLDELALCERERSCFSHVGQGGDGPVSAVMKRQASQGRDVVDTFDRSNADRRKLLADLNKVNDRYQKAVMEEARDTVARRATLQSLHTRLEQAAKTLAEALPVERVRAYAEDLARGVTIAGQPGTTQRINTELRKLSDTLYDALEGLDEDDVTPPPFPRKPGMLDCLRYIPDFAAVACAVFVAELGLPLVLWLLTFLRLSYEIDRTTSPDRDGASQP